MRLTKTTTVLIAAASLLCVQFAAMASVPSKPAKERPQWTEKQAWEWEKKVGEIKGFNQPAQAYPGMTTEQIIKKASELGLNSVRFWVGGRDVQEQISSIRNMADLAEKYGMTVSPVLSIQRRAEYFGDGGKLIPDKAAEYTSEEENRKLAEVENLVKQIVRPFADDPRIVLWDVWNEPTIWDGNPDTPKSLNWVEKMVHWLREEQVSQPITSSLMWDSGRDCDTVSVSWKRRVEVEKLMDVHNFHSYSCAENMGEDIAVTLRKIRKISNRPIVCTECLTRVYGSGVQRTLAVFAKERVHFYIWGLYVSDRNWTTKWNRSTYDPYDPMFHNLLWADGDAWDAREIPYIRDFRFWKEGENLDPGMNVTDRWSHERAWRRMVSGPVKGFNAADVASVPEGYNSVRIKLEFSGWKAAKDAFFARTDKILSDAEGKGMTVLFTLLDDDDISNRLSDLQEYVRQVVARYYDNQTVQAWDLYWHPGEKAADVKRVEEVIDGVLAYARNQYANQPITMTPYVKVKDFAPDFDYHAALIHGIRNGWNRLTYGGVSDSALVYKIWSLSDVISFSTDQAPAEAGWLLSIAYRFGRPIFCTSFKEDTETARNAILERFAMSHVFWYTDTPVSERALSDFEFIPIQTKH